MALPDLTGYTALGSSIDPQDECRIRKLISPEGDSEKIEVEMMAHRGFLYWCLCINDRKVDPEDHSKGEVIQKAQQWVDRVSVALQPPRRKRTLRTRSKRRRT